MQSIIVSNEQSLASQVRSLLELVEGIPFIQRAISHEAALTPGAIPADTDLVIFFCSAGFCERDLSVLTRLAQECGSRARIIGVGSASAAGNILKAIRSGAADYLDVNDNFQSEFRTLIGRLQFNHGSRAAMGRLFTVLGATGGVGASLIASNLAVLIAKSRKSCGLFDLHLRGGDLAKIFNASPRHTLASLASKAQQLDRTMLEQSLVSMDCGVRILASPEPFSDYRQLSAQLIQRVMQLAGETLPYVVVDLEDAEHAEQARIVAASDQVILPMRLDFVSLCRTKKCLEHLLAARVPVERITVVANRVGQPNELPLKGASEALGVCIKHQLPDDPAAANASFNLGKPLILSEPRSPLAQALVRLSGILLDEQPAETPESANWWLPSSEMISKCIHKLAAIKSSPQPIQAKA